MRIAEARETNDPITRSSRETHLARASGKPGIPAEAGARALGDRLASFSRAEQELMENGQTFPNLTGKVKKSQLNCALQEDKPDDSDRREKRTNRRRDEVYLTMKCITALLVRSCENSHGVVSKYVMTQNLCSTA